MFPRWRLASASTRRLVHQSNSAEAIRHDSRPSAAHIASGTLLMSMIWMAFLNVSNQVLILACNEFAKINLLTQLNAVFVVPPHPSSTDPMIN